MAILGRWPLRSGRNTFVNVFIVIVGHYDYEHTLPLAKIFGHIRDGVIRGK